MSHAPLTRAGNENQGAQGWYEDGYQGWYDDRYQGWYQGWYEDT